MAKFIDTHSAEMIIRWHSSKDEKIKALYKKSIYDENDIRSWYAIAKIIICLLWVMTMTFLMLNYNLIKL